MEHGAMTIYLKRGKVWWWAKPANSAVAGWTGIPENAHEHEAAKVTREQNPGAKVLTFCGRCGGTGRYVTMVLNGKPTGPGGECYRCEGKGWQTEGDEVRNAAYDRYAFSTAMRSMLA
jgi:hypothetical protein